MPLIPVWYLAWGVPWAVAAALYARTKSRNPLAWAVLGFFFSFVALIGLWIMGDGPWRLEDASGPGEDDLDGPHRGETTQLWREPPGLNQAAAAAWWTSADAGSLGHRSGDGSRRN